jgi:hypothetical protein
MMGLGEPSQEVFICMDEWSCRLSLTRLLFLGLFGELVFLEVSASVDFFALRLFKPLRQFLRVERSEFAQTSLAHL